MEICLEWTLKLDCVKGKVGIYIDFDGNKEGDLDYFVVAGLLKKSTKNIV